MSLSPSPSKEDIQPALPVLGLVYEKTNVNGTCKPPALATGTSAEGACSICPTGLCHRYLYAFHSLCHPPHHPLILPFISTAFSPLLFLTSHLLAAVNYTRSAIIHHLGTSISSAGTPRCAL